MISHPRREEAIEHPLARQAAATLVHVIGHRYGRDWLAQTVEGMADDPPRLAEPIPDPIPIAPAERTA